MICCEKCNRIIGTIHESEELEVRGEVTLVFMCPSIKCKHISHYELYKYDRKRIKNSSKK
jgi:hypothetical protein